MFSFHKPKIYRSNLGCCICKAKSSSSRFTDSTKYENEFERCFRIQEKRSGEICNACVLLVKRWKKLSPENKLTKHWHHVVDARAGPGTKSTGSRRLTSASVSTNSSTNSHGSNHHQNESGNKSQSHHSSKPDILPLSSSQTNNQSSSASGSNTRARTNSFGNKIRYNPEYSSVSDELPRRSYMSVESNYQRTSGGLSLTKQNSANIPSPFESVIKRFRQRQQQQQLETQRRQMNRQLRRQQLASSTSTPTIATSTTTQDTAADRNSKDNKLDQNESVGPEPDPSVTAAASRPASKRVKRYSDSIGAINIDGFRVSTVLDNSIWRKEKVCCGTIFRGLYNEVAIFPKLLKPCQHRLIANDTNDDKIESTNDETTKTENNICSIHKRIASPPPRTTKSGSISSCDSNTSGTGSMEGNQGLEDYLIGDAKANKQLVTSTLVRPNILLGSKRHLPSSMQPTSKRVRVDNQSPTSSSGTSTSRLPSMISNEEEEDLEDGVVLEAEIVSETSEDATSSSIESLTSIEAKKSGGVVKTAVA